MSGLSLEKLCGVKQLDTSISYDLYNMSYLDISWAEDLPTDSTPLVDQLRTKINAIKNHFIEREDMDFEDYVTVIKRASDAITFLKYDIPQSEQTEMRDILQRAYFFYYKFFQNGES